MRIATWNLDGKWSLRHRRFLESLDADIVLLTEVHDSAEIPGMTIHRTRGKMQHNRSWAAIAARMPVIPLPDPHGATALAKVDGLRVASSVLPWRTCGDSAPWVGPDQASRTDEAVTAIEAALPIIWGGDWNHELTGRLYAGCEPGRTRLLDALKTLGLDAPTAPAPHRLPATTSIDHIAVPTFWSITALEHVSGEGDGTELSDHDAYLVTID